MSAIRAQFGVTQAELAETLGVPQQSVSAWERDKTSPIGPVAILLEKALGVGMIALETGKGFEVPAGLPMLRAEGSGPVEEPGGGGGVAIEGEDMKPIHLPPVPMGEIWLVNTGTGESGSLAHEDALAKVTEAMSQGDAVWVILKPQQGNRQK